MPILSSLLARTTPSVPSRWLVRRCSGNHEPREDGRAESDARASNGNVFCLAVGIDADAGSATGTHGNVGVGTVQAPGYFDVDLGLSRVFRIRERQSVEFRAEAFNVANHTNFGPPTTALNSATFGRILTDVSPRIMQFALKVVF